jgi:hypothetical protein
LHHCHYQLPCSTSLMVVCERALVVQWWLWLAWETYCLLWCCKSEIVVSLSTSRLCPISLVRLPQCKSVHVFW